MPDKLRKLINKEDSPEWTPPDYAVSDGEESSAWKAPSYAKAEDAKPVESERDKERKKHTFFGDLKTAIGHPIDDFVNSMTSRKPEERNVLERLIMSQDPGQESVLPSAKTIASGFDPETKTQGVLHGIYDNLIRPIGSAAGAAGLVTAEEGVRSPTRAVEPPPVRRTEIPYRMGGTAQEPTPRGFIGEKSPLQTRADKIISRMEPPVEKIEPGVSSRPVPDDLQDRADAIIEQFLESKGLEEGDHQPNRRISLLGSENPPVRQPRTTPMLENPTPQQSNVAIAQTRDNIPRTARNISIETGIPQPSVRRSISEIKKKTIVPEEVPPPIDTSGQNLSLSQLKRMRDDLESMPDAMPDHPNHEEWGKRHDVVDDLITRKDPSFNDLPPRANQTKSSFVNPFEKKIVDEKGLEIAPQQSEIPTEVPIKAPGTEFRSPSAKEISPAELPIRRDILRDYTGESFNPEMYDKARERLNMGLDKPVEAKAEQKLPEYFKPVEEAKTKWKAPGYAEEQPKSLIEQVPDLQQEKHPINPSADDIELQGGLGGIKPSKRVLEPNSGPYGAALDKLFDSMGTISERRLEQDVLNKAERARRFSAFNSVDEVGVKGASQSLSKLKGEFDKVDLDKLKMTAPQVDSLFTAVKRANITAGEKARGYTALFKLFNGEIPQRNELGLLDDVFGNNFAAKITEMHGGIGAVGMNLAKAANTMKTLQASFDVSAPLRQGIGLITRKEFGPAFKDMFKFYADKEFYKSSMDAIESRPNYLLGREAGLDITHPGSLQNAEEAFLNSYVGQIPLVNKATAASERAYVGFLNKLRSDTFESMIQQAKDLGVDVGTAEGSSREAKAIAKFINTATGRGDLGKLNKITNELNTVLWSPKLIASRIQMLTNPKIYTDLPKGMRLQGLRSLLGIASLGVATDTLARYAGGAHTSTNILSSDFGKSRFGNQVLDPWGGFQQYIVGAARFLAGKTDSKMPTSRMDILGRFAANKESPAASLAHLMLTAKFTGKSNDPKTAGNLTTEYGEKSSVQAEVAKRFIPMFVQDINELVQADPEWAEHIGLTAALTGASALGMGVQNYPERKKSVFGKQKIR